MTEAEKNPAGEGGASEGHIMKDQGDQPRTGANTGTAPGAGSLPGCPGPYLIAALPWDMFPERMAAIRKAYSHTQLIKAIQRYAFAALFVRHATRNAGDLRREALAGEIRIYAKLSKVRPMLPREVIWHIVNAADDAAREALS